MLEPQLKRNGKVMNASLSIVHVLVLMTASSDPSQRLVYSTKEPSFVYSSTVYLLIAAPPFQGPLQVTTMSEPTLSVTGGSG